jgi:Nucleotidyl transferase AbiEii toxin, Type IV TA system
LIARFSEDIDITVFREDIGQPATVEGMEALSGKKRTARLNDISAACQEYVNGPMLEQLTLLLRGLLESSNLAVDSGRVEPDLDDPDRQSLLLWYPTVTSENDSYIRRAVKIESGAKSALDPHCSIVVKPYVAEDLPGSSLEFSNVTTVEPSRTFWDKIMILHGLRQWWDRRSELRGGGQRVSRHYYDVYRLLSSNQAEAIIGDIAMADDCARHARMFFNRPDLGLATATPGSFSLKPHDGMLASLEQDYQAMVGMIFGEVPAYKDIVEAITNLESRLNQAAQ